GDIQTIVSKSLNGNIVATTRCKDARKLETKTLAGNVELYIPSHLPLKGEVSSNLGKMDVLLSDIDSTHEQGQLMQKSIRFSKQGTEPAAAPLLVYGETKTGSVLLRYLTIDSPLSRNRLRYSTPVLFYCASKLPQISRMEKVRTAYKGHPDFLMCIRIKFLQKINRLFNQLL